VNSVVALYCCENAKVTSALLWSLYRNIRSGVSRKVGVHLMSFPHTGLTKKPSEVRMGKGRGAISTFISRLRCGSVIYQLSQVERSIGVAALKKVQKYLGFKSRIFIRDLPNVNVKASVIRFLYFNLKMPQLDIVSFPSQVFWLSIFFVIF